MMLHDRILQDHAMIRDRIVLDPNMTPDLILELGHNTNPDQVQDLSMNPDQEPNLNMSPGLHLEQDHKSTPDLKQDLV